MDIASVLSQHADLIEWAAWVGGSLCLALLLGGLIYRARAPRPDATSNALMLGPLPARRTVLAGKALRWLGFDTGSRLRSGTLALPAAGHQRILQALSHSEEELWRRRTVVWPERYLERQASLNARIIAIANITGGPGKAVLAANLAAHFSVGRGLKVLIFDMDAPSGLSDLVMRAAGCSRAAMQLEHWLASDAATKRLIDKSCNLNAAMPAARLVSSTESLADLEARLSSQWVLGMGRDDGRYILAEKLLNRAVEDKFDVVIINAPPRLSIGAINALTAATHLVIPAAIDAVSRRATRSFLQLFQALRPALFPQLALAGIALTTPHGDRMTFADQCEVAAMKRELDSLGLMSAAHMFVRTIPDTIGEATSMHLGSAKRHKATGLHYLDNPAVRAAFADLGDAIAFRANLYCAI